MSNAAMTSPRLEAPMSGPPFLPMAVGLQPREYQHEGIDFFFQRKRALNRDDPGLGKTIQAALAAVPPVLVVCPNYLVGQWGEWLQQHIPSAKTIVAQGDRWKKQAAIFQFAGLEIKGWDPKRFKAGLLATQPAQFLVINKEMLRTHWSELMTAAPHIHTMIIDESHHLRNKDAEVSKRALDLAKIIPRVYECSATPIWKEADDLFAQLRLLYPTVFTSYNVFCDDYLVSDMTRFGRVVYGVQRAKQEEFDRMLSIMVLGRTYKQVARELPPVMEDEVWVEFDKEHRALYDDAVINYRVKFADEDGEDLFLSSMSAVMHTLRQICGWHGKIDAIKDILEDTKVYDQGRVVIFCWYRETAKLLGEAFPGAPVITGAITDPAERRRIAAANARSGLPVIATLASLSEGVDLSWARHVIFAEEHYAPGSHIQSLARVVRERQLDGTEIPAESTDPWDLVLKALDSRAANAEPVLVHYVNVKDSIDETIHRTSKRRGNTIRTVLKEALGMA